MVSHGQVFEQCIAAVAAFLRPLVAMTLFEEEAGIINVIENEYPLSTPHAAKPISNEPEDVGLRLISTLNLDETCDLSHALLEPRHTARMYP